MKKIVFLFFFLTTSILISAQEKKIQISLTGELFSPSNSDYQSITIVNKNMEQTIDGSALGYGLGKGGAINANYFFYKNIGASIEFDILSFENKLVYEIVEISGTVQHKYKNTMDYYTVKIGPVGRINIGDSNFEVQSSAGLAVVFADFFRIHDIGNNYDHLDGEASTFLGPYFRLGTLYRITKMFSLYTDYQYTIIPAEYAFNGTGLGDEREILISNSNLGGNAIRIGLAISF